MPSIYKPSFDLDALRTFIAVVDLAGFTAAASELAKTQSTVSHQIRKLEEQLGCALLERTTRSIALTPSGERFRDDARAILLMAEKSEVRLRAHQIQGEVRLGVPEEIASSLLPDVISTFRREHPRIRVAVTVGVSGNLRRAVDSGELDLAVIKQAPAPSEALVIQPLCWVGQPAVAKLTPVPVAFFPEPCEFRARAIQALQHQGRAYDLVMTTTSYQSLKATCSRGLAITVLATSDCPRELYLDAVQMRDTELPKLPFMGYALQHSGELSPASDALTGALTRSLELNIGVQGRG